VAEVRVALGHERHPELVGILAAIRDDLFEHFAREEEALFPYLHGARPELADAIAKLEGAHDRICGGVSRMIALAEQGERLALLLQVFERFEAEYRDHARSESEFLRGLARLLTEEQRAHVRAVMRDV
jgi:hemerythrin